MMHALAFSFSKATKRTLHNLLLEPLVSFELPGDKGLYSAMHIYPRSKFEQVNQHYYMQGNSPVRRACKDLPRSSWQVASCTLHLGSIAIAFLAMSFFSRCVQHGIYQIRSQRGRCTVAAIIASFPTCTLSPYTCRRWESRRK